MSIMPIVIEASMTNLSHAEATVRLLDEYACSPGGGGKGLPMHVKASLPEALSLQPGCHVLQAYIDDEAVALLIAFEGFSTFNCKPLLNLHDVIVSEAFRGRGLSKLLLAKAEEVATRLGCCKLTLEVLEGNTVAQAAYRSVGYTGYQLDPKMGHALFWEKKLSSSHPQ